MDLPSVFAYLDYRSFLRDWFEARKRQDATYSHGRFAREAGCSRSTLSNVIAGNRTPRADTLDAFARAMNLDPAERNYLGLLVDLTAAQDLDSRREAMDRILASERYKQVRVAENESDSTVFRYVEHWYVPAVRELAGLPGFRADPEWIAHQLRPRISVDQARDALERLFELDFLRRTGDGRVEPQEVRFRTEATAQSAIMHFHRDQVPALLRHVRLEDHALQHLVASTIVLPDSMLPEVKARLDTLVEQLATLADAAPRDQGARVFQLAVQLLAISEEVG